MVEIRYSAPRGKISEMVDISGSWRDFKELRQGISRFLEGDDRNIYFNVDKNINPDGWDLVLDTVEIVRSGGTVKVSVPDNKTLNIKGSRENLKIFADWLDFEEFAESGYHSHYEYFEGNQYIDSNSVPLVIRIK